MNKSSVKGSAKPSAAQKGAPTSSSKRQMKVVSTTSVENELLPLPSTSKMENSDQSKIKFFGFEVVFASTDSVKYKIYIITLLVLGTVSIIWIVKTWSVIAAICKKLPSINLKGFFNKTKP